MVIRSWSRRWKHFWTIRSSQDSFSTLGSQIWPLDSFWKTQVRSWSLDPYLSFLVIDLMKWSWWVCHWFYGKKSLIFRKYFTDFLRQQTHLDCSTLIIISGLTDKLAIFQWYLLIFSKTFYIRSFHVLFHVESRRYLIFRWKIPIFQTLHIRPNCPHKL